MTTLKLAIKRWQYGYKTLSKKAVVKAYKKRGLLGKAGILMIVLGLVTNLAALPILNAAGARLIGPVLKVRDKANTTSLNALTDVQKGEKVRFVVAIDNEIPSTQFENVIAQFDTGGESKTTLTPKATLTSTSGALKLDSVSGSVNLTLADALQKSGNSYYLEIYKIVLRNTDGGDTDLTSKKADLLGSGLDLGALAGGESLFINTEVKEKGSITPNPTPAHLSLSLTQTKNQVIEGKNEEVEYQATITNTGDMEAKNISTYSSVTFKGDAKNDPGYTSKGPAQIVSGSNATVQPNNEGSISITSLKSKESVVYKFTNVIDQAKAGDTLTTVARGLAKNIDSQTQQQPVSSNSVTLSVVANQAALKATTNFLAASPQPAEVKEIPVEATITNTSAVNAENVTINLNPETVSKSGGTATYVANSLKVTGASAKYDAKKVTSPITLTNLTPSQAVKVNYIVKTNNKLVPGDKIVSKITGNATNATAVSASAELVVNQPVPGDKADLVIDGKIVDGKKLVTSVNRLPGQEVKFRITLTNNGPETATNGKIAAALSPYLNIKEFKGATNITLKKGESKTVELTSTIKDDKAAFPESKTVVLTNQFTANATKAVREVKTGNLVVNVTRPAPAPDNKPSLTLTQTVDKAKAEVGNTLTYTVTFKNNGKEVAKNVVISEKLASQLTYVSSTYKNTGSQTKVYSIGDIKPGESKSFQVKAKIKAGVPTRTLITTIANAKYQDPKGRDYTAGPASATTEVVGRVAGVSPDREGTVKGAAATPKSGSAIINLALMVSIIGTLFALGGYALVRKAKKLETLDLQYVTFA